MKNIIVKTNKKIGKFLNNSYIDNIPIREVDENELKNIHPDDYEIINTDNMITIGDINKILKK